MRNRALQDLGIGQAWQRWIVGIGAAAVLLAVGDAAAAATKVKVINPPTKPIPVTVVDENVAATRVQFAIAGSFGDGEDILGPAPGSEPPQKVVVPSGQTLFVEHVSCRSTPEAGQRLDVAIVVVEDRGPSVRVAKRPHSPALQSVLVRDSLGTLRETLVSNETTRFCAGPACEFMSSTATWQGAVELEAQRDVTDGFARIDCILNGTLLP